MFNTPASTPFNNPYLTPQQRMEQMVNQYPQYFNQNIQQAVGSQGWRILPASNIEEANATPADLSGNPIFFFNKATKEIYMKQLDQTGAAPIVIFSLKEQIKMKEAEISNYQNDLKKLNNKVDAVYNIVTALSETQTPKVNKNAKQ